MTLNLKTANQSSCMALWPMMMHYHTKFGYKRFSSGGNIVQMNIYWKFEPFLWLWPWQQKSNPKDQQFKSYESFFLLYSPSLWPWPWSQKTNLFGRQSGSWWCITIPNFAVKGWRFRRYCLDKHSLTFWNFAMILTLNKAIQFVHETLWLIVMYYQTKFGSKRVSSS